MTNLEIHAYNVGFGDAILIRVPRTRRGRGKSFRDILIDGGNSLMGSGGDDRALADAMEDIHDKTRGDLDLYVMTHEHMDHVQGPLLLKERRNKSFTAERVWLTPSAAPDYYDRFPDAKEKKRLALNMMQVMQQQALPLSAEDRACLDFILGLNNPRRTQDCVDHILGEIPKTRHRVHYVHADTTAPAEIKRILGIPEIDVEIWAPEENTATYYGRFRPLAMAGAFGADRGPQPAGAQPSPPPGVSMADFYRLTRSREGGFFANALMIDKAANNTSVVLLITWNGKRLLFAGDAEERSWRHIQKRDLVTPVDFLKISHHGSHNGTPDDVFKRLLLDGRNGGRPKTLISTIEDQHSGVPFEHLMRELRDHTDLTDTRDVALGRAVVMEFAP